MAYDTHLTKINRGFSINWGRDINCEPLDSRGNNTYSKFLVIPAKACPCRPEGGNPGTSHSITITTIYWKDMGG